MVHADQPDLNYLSGATVTNLRVDGRPVGRVPPEVLADVDEVEFVYTYPGVLRLVVRHTFAAGWGIRMVFMSLSATPQTVDEAEFLLRPQGGCVAWALAAGVRAMYSIAPATGTGAVLGGLLRLGSVERATDAGLELARFELEPQARYVVQTQWDWYATPRTFGQLGYPETPSSLCLFSGEAVQLEVDDDVAVLAPSDLETSQREGRLDVLSDISGTYPMELRSARGTTTFDLQWVEPVEELLRSLTDQALSGPRAASGVIKLAGVADALIVQHALALARIDDPDEAADALDLFTARLGGADPLSPLETAYLCREYDRNGDLDQLQLAADAVLCQSSIVPGLGIAATQLCVGLMVSGHPVGPVMSHLLQLIVGLEAGDEQLPSAAALSPAAAALELIAVTSAGPGASGAIKSTIEVAPRIAALGLHLGAGLKGRAISPLPVADLSHLIAVFGLLPDGLSAQLEDIWGCSAHALASRARPELVARLAGLPIGDAHAWLVLALQTD